MGGNYSYNKGLGGVPENLRTHDELSTRIEGHKILLQKGNDSRVKIPMNSNSESPIYLGAHRKKDGTIEITTFGIYEKHKCVGQVDLKFDQNGNLIPFANNGAPCEMSIWDTIKIDGHRLEDVLQNSYIVNIS